MSPAPLAPPTPAVAPRPRLFSLVWLVPLAAAMLGLWLAYTSYRDRGPDILIEFSTGAGITPGKTAIKRQGVTVGVVRRIELEAGTGAVLVHARLNQDAANLAREDSRFWMVSPRLSLKEASGLDTLLTGQYITVHPGQGSPAYRFRALESPPTGEVDASGLHLVLEAPDMAGVGIGAPVLHRSVRVGQVTHIDPPTAHEPIQVHAAIEVGHTNLVRRDSRFWRAGGVSVQADLDGVRVGLESVSALLEGGVAFATPEGMVDSPPAEERARFTLFPDSATALAAGPTVWLDCPEPSGLRSGAAVLRRGNVVGRVQTVRMRPGEAGAELTVLLRPEAADLTREGTLYWVERPALNEAGVHGMSALLRGPHLEAAAGVGALTNRFPCASAPPAYRPDEPGLHLRLLAPRALPRGTVVRSRGLPVGRVTGCEFDAQTGWIITHTVVDSGFGRALTSQAGFWLESGAQVDFNWNGLRAVLPSLAGWLSTGIAVETAPGGKPADTGMIFPLHESREEALAEGIALTLTLPETRGLLEGATVNYRGVPIGRVTRLEAGTAADGFPVLAHLRLQRGRAAFAAADARYWLVEPSLSLGGSSNLFSYVTGPWLESRPGQGERVSRLALSAPETWRTTARPFSLVAPQASGAGPGSPVLFLGLEAGEITARHLEPDGLGVRLEGLLRAEFWPHLRAQSRFFEAGGVRVSGGLRGLRVESAPLAALVSGGVGFFNPVLPGEDPGRDPRFALHPSEEAARQGGQRLDVVLSEASGLIAGAEVRARGAGVGQVESVRLHPDLRSVVAQVRLHDGMEAFARADARFWLVRADISLRGVRDADTLLTGPHLAASPGEGEPVSRIRAWPNPPPTEPPGLALVLRAPRAASLAADLPVLFRDLPVGAVTRVELAPRADHVRVHLRIEPRFAGLVTPDSRFWNAGGFGLNVGLFGAKLRSSTLESLLSGAISFATPSAGAPVADGAEFNLASEPQEEWLKWNPALNPAPVSP
jgi:paraquat-inducible protein B